MQSSGSHFYNRVAPVSCNFPIYQKLTELAIKRSSPFCYQCYEVAPTGTCSKCHSDDLMRLVDGVGCDYGTEWVVKHILEEELTPVNTDEAFEESVRACYPETVRAGWMSLDIVSVIKTIDPVSWDIALSEWERQEVEDGGLFTFDDGLTYYWLSDLESLLE